MDYVISTFLLGLIVTFVVIVGLARAAEFPRWKPPGASRLIRSRRIRAGAYEIGEVEPLASY